MMTDNMKLFSVTMHIQQFFFYEIQLTNICNNKLGVCGIPKATEMAIYFPVYIFKLFLTIVQFKIT